MAPEVAVLAEPFAVGVHGVTRSGLKMGDTAVVQGAGAIGLLTLIGARASGAGRLIVVGGPAGRLALARRLGADLTIDIGEIPDPAARAEIVRAHTPLGKGADVVFECAGFLAAIPEGITYLRQGGTYVEMGHFVDVGTIELNPNQMLLRKNLRLEAIYGYGGNDLFIRGVALLERGEFPFAELVDPILPLERAADGFAALTGGYRLDGRDVVKIALRGAASSG
jgi:threonine dehydrogenase-like Zn-dependent dehydrogenase